VVALDAGLFTKVWRDGRHFDCLRRDQAVACRGVAVHGAEAGTEVAVLEVGVCLTAFFGNLGRR